MTAPHSRRLRRREFATLGGGAIATGLGSLSAIGGCTVRSAKMDPIVRYRISGPSMNPTLWGPSRSIDCQSCSVQIRVDESLLRLAMERTGAGRLSSSLLCWHCGTSICGSQFHAATGGRELRPDVVEVIGSVTGDLEGGDILLIGKDGSHVKRLLGKPGQTISTDDAGRLLVDGRRPAFSMIPPIAVDWDRLRSTSRWHGSADATRWQRQANRHWSARGNTDWLVYEHKNIYHGDRPGRVLDDYPGNLGVQRSLFPADGLSVRFEVDSLRLPPNAEVDVRIAFWTEHGVDLQRQTITNQGASWVEAAAERSLPDKGERRRGIGPATLPSGLFSARRPIGIKMSTASEGVLSVRDLSVSREVLFRINPHRPRSDVANNPQPPRYPLYLGDDEWFVVGDNVPLSIDSRSWGTIAGQQIVGRVDAVS